MAQEVLRYSFSKKLWRRDSERQFFIEIVAQEVLRDSFSQKLWRRDLGETVFLINCGAGIFERQFF